MNIVNSIGFVDKVLLTKHLSIMIKNGIPLIEALNSIADQATNPKLKELLGHIAADIANGKTLTYAIEKHPDVFDPLYVSLISVGETSGNLENNLDYLAVYLRKQYEFKKKVKGALLYPVIVVTAATLVGAFASFYVLPQLIDLFESLDVELPLSTRILLFIARILKDYSIYILGGIALLVILLKFMLARPKIRRVYEQILFKLPVFGAFFQNIQLTFLCRNLGIMLKSGISITLALQTQYQGTTNLIYKEYVGNLQKSVDKGRSLFYELSHGHYTYIPKITTKMIGVGEETGNLDESLLYLADFFEDEVDSTTKNFTAILEPFLLIIIGIIVGFVAFSIISPIYGLVGNIKQ